MRQNKSAHKIRNGNSLSYTPIRCQNPDGSLHRQSPHPPRPPGRLPAPVV